MSPSAHPVDSSELPPVDLRLVAPETRYEIEDGKVIYVAAADEPHGVQHAVVAALVMAHVAPGFEVAVDMLTRTSLIDDMAPDVSVFPAERDPETQGRRLEELAFEIVNTQRLNNAGRKAGKLMARGVRRVFAIDVTRERGFEWSLELGTWSMLADDATLEDPALASPLPVAALVRAAAADDAMASALLAKSNRVLREAVERSRTEGKLEGKTEGKAEALLAILTARGLAPTESQRQRVLAAPNRTLDQWLEKALLCASVHALLETT